MKLDIPYYIRQVLREQRKVYIPGIGTFQLDHMYSIFNDDKTVLSPPVLKVSFNETESDDDSLLKYILDTGLTTEAKARKKIEQYTEAAFNKLLNVDSFVIEGVGKLVKKEEQDKVGFEPHISELTREFSDLPSLSLTPISRIQEQVPSAQIVGAVPIVEESGTFLPRILLFSLLFIGLFFLGKYLYNSYNSQPEEELTEIPIVEDEQEQIAISDSSEKELELRYEEIDELIDPVKEKEIVDSEQATESKMPKEKIDPKQSAIIEEPVVAEPQKDVPKEEPEAKTVAPPIEEVKNSPVNKYADIIPESGECIIVVGSFIKSLNAIKMTSLLERKGYSVYRSEYKGFTRIGIRYECSNEDLEAYLKNIRNKVSKKAWYLDPDLDVPYSI